MDPLSLVGSTVRTGLTPHLLGAFTFTSTSTSISHTRSTGLEPFSPHQPVPASGRSRPRPKSRQSHSCCVHFPHTWVELGFVSSISTFLLGRGERCFFLSRLRFEPRDRQPLLMCGHSWAVAAHEVNLHPSHRINPSIHPPAHLFIDSSSQPTPRFFIRMGEHLLVQLQVRPKWLGRTGPCQPSMTEVCRPCMRR